MAGLGDMFGASMATVNGKNQPKFQYRGPEQAGLPTGDNVLSAIEKIVNVLPVIGGSKGAIEEYQAGNPISAALNAATVPLDIVSGGLGGALLKGGLLAAMRPSSKALKMTDFVKSKDGSIDLARMPQDAGGGAPLRMFYGHQDGADGSGLIHIDTGKGDRINRAGFNTTEDFIESILSNPSKVKLQNNGRYAVIKNRKNGDAVIAEKVNSDTGDYFSVVTAIPSSNDKKYIERLGNTIWEERPHSSLLPEYQPSVTSQANISGGFAPGEHAGGQIVESSIAPLSLPARAYQGFSPQYRAALERGLDMSTEGRMARARELGMNTAPSKEVYHSARDAWESSIVDPAKSDLGFHVGTLEQADNRAKAFGFGGVNYGEGANIMPLMTDKHANMLKLKDVGTFHADGIAPQLEKKGLLAKGKGKQIEKAIDENWRLREQYDPMMRDVLKQNDFDGIKYANEQEGAGLSYAFTNPAMVRSRFAAFDPVRRHEADLLGNIDPRLLGAMGVGSLGTAAAVSQLPEEYKSAIGAAFK